jgi:glycine betaine/proline transport system substrate-binding protein
MNLCLYWRELERTGDNQGKVGWYMTSRHPLRWLMMTAFLTLTVVVAACDTNGGTNGDGAGAREPELDRPIVFADYGWDSAILLNRTAQFILEHGYGYETETIFGETIPLFQGMLAGDIDVSMEIWVDQNPAFQPAVDDGSVLNLGTSVDNTVQGWWVPTYVIEGDEERGIEPMAPDLRHVDDLPDYWELFRDPEDPNKGRLYDGVAGWEAERINEAKFHYYGLDEYYNRFLPGSGAALDTSLISAYERGEPWLGYYWTPTWVAGLVDITLLEEPPYSDECWDQIYEGTDACAWPITEAVISVTTEFSEEAPEVVRFLELFTTDESHVSQALAYMADTDSTREEAAIWFLQNNEELWTQWVDEDAEERVRAALNDQ